MMIETRIPVRYAETDQMGIVHHSVYPIWYECGRTDFIKQFGISYAELERLGLMLPLLRLSCEYKLPIRYGETALVRTRLLRGTKARLIIGYEVYAEERNILCGQGSTEHAWTDINLKPVNIARFKPELYERLMPMCSGAVENNSL